MIPNSDITIYNRYIDPDTRKELFQRTEISGVVWQSTKAVSGLRTGLLSSNVASIFIPFALGTQYASPKTWTPGGSTWTLREGDIIARGIVTEEITALYTLTDLRTEYNDVVQVTSVDAMDEGSPNMQHWEVGCK